MTASGPNGHPSRSIQRIAWITARALCGEPVNGETARLAPGQQGAINSILAADIDARRSQFERWLAGLETDEANQIRQAVLAVDPRGRDPDQVATLADIAEQLANIEWEWNGWLPRGFVTLLVAEQGVGKSFVALWGVAHSVLMGANWPDGTHPMQSDDSLVLWCEAEAAHQLLVERAERAGLPKDRIIFATSDPFATIKLDNPRDVAALRDTIEVHRPRLLIYDALSGGHDKRENSSDEMIPVVRVLSDIARDFQIAVLLVHHVNKSVEAGEISLRTIRGASGITQLARVVWALEKLDDQGWLRLRTIKCNIGTHPPPIGVRIAENRLEYGIAPEPGSAGKPIDTAKDWLDKLLQDGPVAAVEVYAAAERANICAKTLERAKKALKVSSVKNGFGRGSQSHWSLPSASQQGQRSSNARPRRR